MMDAWLEFISSVVGSLAWPAVVVVTIIVLRKPLSAFLDRSQSLKVKVPGGTEIELTAVEAEEIVQDVLDGIDELIDDVRPEEKDVLRRANANANLLVSEAFEDYERKRDGKSTPEHLTLQSLRKRHLIRPREGSTWDDYKHVEITPFGRLVLKLRGKGLLL